MPAKRHLRHDLTHRIGDFWWCLICHSSGQCTSRKTPTVTTHFNEVHPTITETVLTILQADEKYSPALNKLLCQLGAKLNGSKEFTAETLSEAVKYFTTPTTLSIRDPPEGPPRYQAHSNPTLQMKEVSDRVWLSIHFTNIPFNVQWIDALRQLLQLPVPASHFTWCYFFCQGTHIILSSILWMTGSVSGTSTRTCRAQQ